MPLFIFAAADPGQWVRLNHLVTCACYDRKCDNRLRVNQLTVGHFVAKQAHTMENIFLTPHTVTFPRARQPGSDLVDVFCIPLVVSLRNMRLISPGRMTRIVDAQEPPEYLIDWAPVEIHAVPIRAERAQFMPTGRAVLPNLLARFRLEEARLYGGMFPNWQPPEEEEPEQQMRPVAPGPIAIAVADTVEAVAVAVADPVEEEPDSQERPAQRQRCDSPEPGQPDMDF